jgi:hypothetical protein
MVQKLFKNTPAEFTCDWMFFIWSYLVKYYTQKGQVEYNELYTSFFLDLVFQFLEQWHLGFEGTT